ncbi:MULTISPECIES: hypothetical protein [Enterobacter cloacae complex]|nr:MULTISPECIES: hypothetical protein [Enterobacter cloacae complex]AVU50547.1 hypothetical protein AXJ76_10885 [Enterobacter cloacae]EHE7809945.1 hypothetical protein [Enterobacter hormaechei]EHF3574278.1 hypothetical protein [Enterobacter hormaechei]KJM70675.1 hypothetical protein SS16_22580 [Enterobacter hormaechei subsp. xiangfangensis]KUH54078.1 hypothetical protein APR64_00095 [Enterobacter hormaechei]
MAGSYAMTKPVKVIEVSESFVDVYAEVAAITTYEAQSSSHVNFGFMREFIESYADENGQPSSSQVVLKKVASITMTDARARALYDALGLALKVKGEEK